MPGGCAKRLPHPPMLRFGRCMSDLWSQDGAAPRLAGVGNPHVPGGPPVRASVPRHAHQVLAAEVTQPTRIVENYTLLRQLPKNIPPAAGHRQCRCLRTTDFFGALQPPRSLERARATVPNTHELIRDGLIARNSLHVFYEPPLKSVGQQVCDPARELACEFSVQA